MECAIIIEKKWRSTMTLYYTAISGIDVAALLILDYIIRTNSVTTIRIKGFFRLSILATIISITAEAATLIFGAAPAGFRVPNIIFNIIGFSVSPLIPLMTGYAISNQKQKRALIFAVPFAVNFISSLLSARFPIIFWVSADNTYFRGSFFWIFILAYGSGMLYLLIETILETSRYQNKNRVVLFTLFIFLTLGTTIQIVAPKLYISWSCISFATSLYYIYYCVLSTQIDGLTELLNRNSYESYILKIKGSKSASFLFFDIDDFKNVNDKYGHPFGDYCLTAVSSKIRDIFSGIGLCFRIGGDEFCVIIKNENREAVKYACGRFINEIGLMRITDTRIPMVSVGYSFYSRENGTIDEAISEADKKMYILKQERKTENVILD